MPRATSLRPQLWVQDVPTIKSNGVSARWAQYQASPIKDESEEEVIFLSSSPENQEDPPFPGHLEAHRILSRSRKPPSGTTSAFKEDSSDPEIIEFVSQENTFDSDYVKTQADRSVGRLKRLPHIRQQPFPWRRATVHSIHGGRGNGTVYRRESRGAVVKCEDESSPPDVTDTALVDVVGGLPKRLGAGEVTTTSLSSYRASPRKCKDLHGLPARPLVESTASLEDVHQEVMQCEQETAVASSSAVLHCDLPPGFEQASNPNEEKSTLLAEEPHETDDEALQCQTIAENCLKILTEELACWKEMLSIYVTLNIGQPGSFLSSLEEPVGFAPSPNEVSEELVASQENAEEVPIALLEPEDVQDGVNEAVEDGLENGVDHCEHAVSSSGSSSSSSVTNPEFQSLRQRIDACVAAQGPLREKANEMLRSLHHHRAMLKAARKEVEKSAKSAEVAAKVRQAQLLAELRHSHSQVWQIHAHCIAENIDLKEKLRASVERREKLLKEIQLVKMSPDFPQQDLGLISPPPGLELDDESDYTSSGETKTESEPEESQGVCQASNELPCEASNIDKGGKDVSHEEFFDQGSKSDAAEQPEPEPLKSPQVLPMQMVVPTLQSLPQSMPTGRNDLDLVDLEVAPPPGLETLQTRSVAAEARVDSRESGVEVKGRCWVAKPNKSKVPTTGAKGFTKRRLSALSVGMEVGGVILHSSWLGAFVNVGAAIDGL
eukprot:symbB.v1.2.023897.t1/scaffold2224.1/size85388/1